VSAVQLCLNLQNLNPRYPGGVPLLEQLDAAAETGVELVAFDAGSFKQFLAAGGSVEQAARELEARGLGCYELFYLECTPHNPQGTLAAAERLAVWAGELGARYVLSSCPTPVVEPSVELFARCCDVMARYGTGLAYEFFPWAPINRFGLAHELVQRAARRNAGVMIDSWHFLHGPDDWSVLETLPLEAVAYLQFTDSKPVAPADYAAEALTCRRFPGEGCLELERFAATLRARGYAGAVSIEVISHETRALGAREFARRCVESSRRYWE
jgi:sugar phosphate isomerase/epimerase